jgi:hypothetical protein
VGDARYDSYQSPYNPSFPPPERVYDNQGVSEGQFSFLSPVVFDGAWFAGYDFATVQFNLYLSSVLVASSSSLAPSGTPTFLGSGYAGLVDKVGVVAPADFFVMDDVTYESGSSTPEPASLSLVGGAMGLLAFVVLRRRRA